jgi:hypothetical protein
MDWVEAWNDLERELDTLREYSRKKLPITGHVEEAVIDQIHEKMSQLKMQVLTGGRP